MIVETPRPDDYSPQRGCWSCRHCYSRPNGTTGPEMLCALLKPDRPPDVKNEDDEVPEGQLNAIVDAFETWARFREVEAHGLCGAWGRD